MGSHFGKNKISVKSSSPKRAQKVLVMQIHKKQPEEEQRGRAWVVEERVMNIGQGLGTSTARTAACSVHLLAFSSTGNLGWLYPPGDFVTDWIFTSLIREKPGHLVLKK